MSQVFFGAYIATWGDKNVSRRVFTDHLCNLDDTLILVAMVSYWRN